MGSQAQRSNTGWFTRSQRCVPILASIASVLLWNSPFDSIPHPAVERTQKAAPKSRGTRVQRLVGGLNESILELRSAYSDDILSNANIRPATALELEEWAFLVFESMSAASRDFHSVEHVFDISQGADAVQTISAYFHDVVYYSIDGGLSELQADKLEGVIVEDREEKSVSLRADGIARDPLMSMVTGVFGFEAGQKLNPFRGLNEFLSAAVAVRTLRGVLASHDLVRIAACIEATIPFRGTNKDGKTVGDMLHGNLKRTREKFPKDLGVLSDEDIIQATKQAINLSNRDVANFAGDPETFLSNTWSLLPESNIAIQKVRVYRISSFTFALKKMTEFFHFVDPKVIYNQFEDEPPDEEYAGLTERATQNLDVAKTYMDAKLLSISVLGALAEQTGGDSTLSHWVGEFQEDYVTPRVEDGIEPIPDPRQDLVLDDTVFRILREGRSSSSSFDIRNSPIAAFLYGLIGDEGLAKSMDYAVYPMDEENAEKLLRSLPKLAVGRIALACAKVATTRAEGLMQIAGSFSGPN
uniref:Uncharacterized protein n=1 Tax=Odontella aurita TaxID=265563 RepID=A0A7S4J366_9STRA|mmetsp:Transcript_37192/g.111350  ORF Transcript_37192/g.111350 Transcript_37192/m.111350 type:complete len:527 (+) Transcript_37192:132-1712(+)